MVVFFLALSSICCVILFVKLLFTKDDVNHYKNLLTTEREINAKNEQVHRSQIQILQNNEKRLEVALDKKTKAFEKVAEEYHYFMADANQVVDKLRWDKVKLRNLVLEKCEELIREVSDEKDRCDSTCSQGNGTARKCSRNPGKSD